MKSGQFNHTSKTPIQTTAVFYFNFIPLRRIFVLKSLSVLCLVVAKILSILLYDMVKVESGIGNNTTIIISSQSAALPIL